MLPKVKSSLRNSQPVGRSPQKEDSLQEKGEATCTEHKRNHTKFGIDRREDPNAKSSHAKPEVNRGTLWMVFQIINEIFENKLAKCHGESF
jgi:hypothetical protein